MSDWPVVPDEEPDGDEDDEEEDDGPVVVTDFGQVIVTTPTLLSTLLGPDGEVVAALYDRRIVPFGFQPPGGGQ